MPPDSDSDSDSDFVRRRRCTSACCLPPCTLRVPGIRRLHGYACSSGRDAYVQRKAASHSGMPSLPAPFPSTTTDSLTLARGENGTGVGCHDGVPCVRRWCGDAAPLLSRMPSTGVWYVVWCLIVSWVSQEWRVGVQCGAVAWPWTIASAAAAAAALARCDPRVNLSYSPPFLYEPQISGRTAEDEVPTDFLRFSGRRNQSLKMAGHSTWAQTRVTISDFVPKRDIPRYESLFDGGVPPE
ncbi:hypothetical protein B0H11DRAFT_1944168 [Mycena galericulata]|nr:hypothetical protein B0H11DRAFT_1944168 [Mycena galericulata]